MLFAQGLAGFAVAVLYICVIGFGMDFISPRVRRWLGYESITNRQHGLFRIIVAVHLGVFSSLGLTAMAESDVFWANLAVTVVGHQLTVLCADIYGGDSITMEKCSCASTTEIVRHDLHDLALHVHEKTTENIAHALEEINGYDDDRVIDGYDLVASVLRIPREQLGWTNKVQAALVYVGLGDQIHVQLPV